MTNIADNIQHTEINDNFSDDIFRLLRDIIYKKCGICFSENKKYFLKNRIDMRLKKLNIKSFREYYAILKDGNNLNHKDELSTLLNSITVNETSFFRNEPQLHALADNILPTALQENKNMKKKELKIWSAGCSTGEEPYTIAMILLEKFTSQFKVLTPHIVATDLNNSVLNFAKKGIYKDNTLRNLPVPYIEKYFSYDGHTNFIIKDTIKNMVEFKNINLLDEKELISFRNFDIVFCRNVMIYFDEVVKKKIIHSFYNGLRGGGYLFIGHSESLHNISSSFKVVNFEKAQAYKKI